jgi:MFS family permease
MSERSTARLVGWLFIGTFVFSIPGYLLYGPLLDHPDYVLGAGHDTQISLGAFLEILTAICNIGTAVALYPVARRYSPRLALGYVASRVLESTIIVTGVVSVLSVVTLRQQFAGSDAETLTIAGQSLVAFHDWTMLLGPGFCAGIGSGLLLGYLMYKSGLLPRRVATLGLVGGSFALVAATGALLGVYGLQSGPQILLTVPEMIWELTFGIYLVVKGFASPATRREAEVRHVAAPVPALG